MLCLSSRAVGARKCYSAPSYNAGSCARTTATSNASRSRAVLKRNRSTATTPTTAGPVDGIVIGCYEGGELTAAGQALDAKTNGDIKKKWSLSGGKGKTGECALLYGVSEELSRVAIVGLGKKSNKPAENSSEISSTASFKDTVRTASSNGCRALKAGGATTIAVDNFDNDSQSAAEGAFLGLFSYDDMRGKTTPSTPTTPTTNTNGNGTEESNGNGNGNGDERKESHLQLLSSSATTETGWKTGVTIARSQNISRRLGETPSNYLTPSLFVQHVVQAFTHLNQNVDGIASHTSTKYAYQFNVEDKVTKSEIEFPNLDIKVAVRDYDWLREKKMGGVLGVTQGSDEPPRFLEIHYGGRNSTWEKPLCLVGKGITFDTGGISIKPSAGMAAMKGDMGGASCVVGAIHALAALQVPLKVTGLIPLCENMPSGKAIKPGDVLVAMNGKTIEVDNTDAEGRLILADALHYAHSFNPHTIIDLATLTGAIDIALGSYYTGVFTNDQTVWSNLEAAGNVTGEHMWRMPLNARYRKSMSSTVADIRNASNSRGGGSCTAAIFLKDFVKHNRWAHLDIAGVYRAGDGSYPYLTKYMTGVPTRTLVQFARSLASGEFKVPPPKPTTTTETTPTATTTTSSAAST